jgi:hypothetical protein
MRRNRSEEQNLPTKKKGKIDVDTRDLLIETPFSQELRFHRIWLGVIRRTIRDQERTLDHLPCGAGRNPGNIRTVGWNKWYLSNTTSFSSVSKGA